MIRNSTHRITGGPRVAVECDAEGCPESFYLSAEYGAETAADKMRAIGWTATPVPGPLTEYQAMCPEHAETTPEPCAHAVKHRTVVDRVPVCQRCGQRRDESGGPPVGVKAHPGPIGWWAAMRGVSS